MAPQAGENIINNLEEHGTDWQVPPSVSHPIKGCREEDHPAAGGFCGPDIAAEHDSSAGFRVDPQASNVGTEHNTYPESTWSHPFPDETRENFWPAVKRLRPIRYPRRQFPAAGHREPQGIPQTAQSKPRGNSDTVPQTKRGFEICSKQTPKQTGFKARRNN
jgi:hypothetical protein